MGLQGRSERRRAEGGCFADWFGVMGLAKSPDDSIELQIVPQFTWLYVGDPGAQRHLREGMQKDARSE